MIRSLSMVLVAAYMLAVTLPCPIQQDEHGTSAPRTGATLQHSHHDEPSIAGETPETTHPDCSRPILTEPCPCGCEQHAGAAPGGKRLGKMLAGDLGPAPAPIATRAETPLVQLLRARDGSPPDPVPILA